MLKNKFLIAFLIITIPSLCQADPIIFYWTDTTSDVPGSEYTLAIIPPLSSGYYSAILTARTISLARSWYIDWIQIKLDAGKNPDLFNLSAPSGNWNIADRVNDGPNPDHTATVERIGTIPVDGFSALYVSGILAPATLDSVKQGALLDGSTHTYEWSFDFTFAPESSLNPTPTLKVGYYDGVAGRSKTIQFTQMSQKVPEPNSLVLLGLGLIGMGIFLRKKIYK